jgi:hypothetical protein
MLLSGLYAAASAWIVGFTAALGMGGGLLREERRREPR